MLSITSSKIQAYQGRSIDSQRVTAGFIQALHVPCYGHGLSNPRHKDYEHHIES